MATFNPATKPDWRSIAQSRRQHREKTIDAVRPAVPEVPRGLPSNVTGLPSQLLSSDVLDITEKTTESLLGELSHGTVSSAEVTTAFLQRAGLAQKLTNCVTELLTESAIERITYLDQYLKEHGKPVGILHGLPISVKEHISMKGLDLNAGFASWVGRLGADDASILKLLHRSGAVFFARTTEPQTLMHLECSTNILGVTGALLGLRGFCLGIGTDIGGSIRSPAGNNGVYGLRPTTYRLPLDGFAATMLGEEQIVPVVGPMSTSLAGVKVFMKAIIDQQPWLYQPSLIPLPWKEPASQSTGTLLRRGDDDRRKLRIGVLADDGTVRPHSPILRGMETLVDKLQSHPDVDIVPFPAYRHDEAWRIISSMYFADGGAEEREAISASGEPLLPMSEWILNHSPKKHALSLPEVWQLTCEREAYKAAYARHWNSVNTGLSTPGSSTLLQVDAGDILDLMVDVVLCPVGPGVAPVLNTAKYWNYTNDPAKYQDAPVSLQLMARRYEDEKLIEALEFMLEIAALSAEMDSKL
ncbi:Putative amidase signature domain-containing protein [Septoria linicola]|uniref:Amidase signature domain-containing protein n=1 Tax=Septoria linicola TaxID=215465 RepID=A0A9Q9AFP5_9PEZI|nr:Putative amidase signature domain-containing protein [Septoria linicola]